MVKIYQIRLKGYNMKKRLIALLVASGLVFSGCGGGSDGETVPSAATYDLSNYLITDGSSYKQWDKYTFNENGIVVSSMVNSFSTADHDMGDLIEIASTGTLSLIDNKIYKGIGVTATGQYYAQQVKIGDSWINNCTWTNHYQEKKLQNEKLYNDILELTCTNNLYYFAKNKGNIAMIQRNMVNNQYDGFFVYSIEVGDLTIGNIINNDNDIFRLN